ncbi:DNA internalization-related competence protein ComEC/Rec2 [Brevibacillus choshinensis]|uniref:DNA internalization-related competence protein ComEC/Rec2 n=2 Tax=Brevibacillus choshinensis TaxID=54911 RepID=A0ABX7FXL8_BRECH|nr:DNA internalization-related competence protein ComEC/Rec2 [Brevibacillus choshinensis]
MVVGLILSSYLHQAWLLAAGGIGLAVALITAIPVHLRRWILAYTFLSILTGLYFYGYEILHQSVLKPYAVQESSVWVRGTIDSAVVRDGDVARFHLDMQEWTLSGNKWNKLSQRERIAVRILLDHKDEADRVDTWKRGSQWSGRIRLSVPAAARNPHAFDYSRYLHWQGIHVIGEGSYGTVRIEEQSSLWAPFQSWQTDAAGRIDLLFDDPEAAGYMKSLLLGVGEDVDPELQEMYADLGLSHVLAISGLHVTLVSSMFMWILERAGVARRWALLATIGMLIGYVLLVGASASAVRSGLMGGVGLACQVLGKRVDGKDVWAGALIVMLLVNPYLLWQIGFQLSFAVTLGLILFVPFSQHIFIRIPLWIRTLVAVTLAAQAVSFPFLLYHFHQFSMLSWLVNLVITPILSLVVLPLGYIALVAGMLHPFLAGWPVLVSTYLLKTLHEPLFAMIRWNLPFSHWPHPDWWWILLYAGFLFMLPILWKMGYHRQRDAIVYLALFIGFIVLARQPFSGYQEVRITFLDIGQGDSIVVEVTDKKVYLIDAGGTFRFPAREAWRERRDPFEVGKDIVLPFLRARGIERIDRVVMTHGDLDHIGGMAALVPRFSFGEVLVNGAPPEGIERDIIRQFQQKGVPILTGSPGQTWSDAPGVNWKWVEPGQTSSASGNEASIVLQLTAYGKTVLFTGDIESDGESRVVQGGLPEVDVLKVAHHGSNTSSSDAFLAAIRPKTAVISVGTNNRYGHPSAEAMQRLKKSGSKVYRTDRHGAVTLIITPEGMVWQTQGSNT